MLYARIQRSSQPRCCENLESYIIFLRPNFMTHTNSRFKHATSFTKGVSQCLSTAGPRPGNGLWHQIHIPGSRLVEKGIYRSAVWQRLRTTDISNFSWALMSINSSGGSPTQIFCKTLSLSTILFFMKVNSTILKLFHAVDSLLKLYSPWIFETVIRWSLVRKRPLEKPHKIPLLII
jgi:hypothetical protein